MAQFGSGRGGTATTNPTRGKVTVTSSGTYTYTPNASARVGTPGTPVTDSFTVTATNATGGTPETVNVLISGFATVPLRVQ